MEISWHILDESRQVVRCEEAEWQEFVSDPSKKIVARTEFADCRVSTVFLGIAYGFDFFETMVFGADDGYVHDGLCRRYRTWAEAVNGHDEVCSMVDSLAISRSEKLGVLGI